ncbi:unnamed protein product [Thelazia callipaeda]|uniref:E3 ubiquitin-protein ligase PPP1R11 n=1 Tax=Thelazia callipaeda TaxID=103827 RepID=A0A0N5CNS2_THECL|nr:unnamed protein product [Thelazia callipaeda]
MNRSSATVSSSTISVVESEIDPVPEVQRLTLSPITSREPRVQWAADTVDNELLGRNKSKCCCIFKKQKKWSDDSSNDSGDSDCETKYCRGHVESHFSPSSDNQQSPGSTCTS